MKKIIFIFTLFFSISVFGQAVYTDNDGDGVIEYTLTKDGKVIETGYYLSGKMHGTWTSFHSNGKKQAVVKFRSGKKHGKWFFFDQEGRETFTVTYENDKKVMASQNRYSSN